MSYLTEDEAKTKWCPHVRLSNGPDGTWNKLVGRNADVTKPETYNCIGSACMMWRGGDTIGFGPDGKRRDRDLDGRTRWVERGYCGLAETIK